LRFEISLELFALRGSPHFVLGCRTHFFLVLALGLFQQRTGCSREFLVEAEAALVDELVDEPGFEVHALVIVLGQTLPHLAQC